jgi:hypothetical protein
VNNVLDAIARLEAVMKKEDKFGKASHGRHCHLD